VARDRAAFNDCVIRVGRSAKVFAWQRLRRETVRYPNSFRTCLLQYRIVRELFGFQPPSNKHSAAVTEPNTGRPVVNLDRDVSPSFSQEAERQAGRSGMKASAGSTWMRGGFGGEVLARSIPPSVVSASHSLTAASASSRSAPLSRAYRYTASRASADVASSAMAWRAAVETAECSGVVRRLHRFSA
jgi:hypothetical protein